jgi:hypothetical protein
MKREELLVLSGQIVNGILSSDSSVLSKIIDRTMHKQIAESAVEIAKKMLEKIDEEEDRN